MFLDSSNREEWEDSTDEYRPALAPEHLYTDFPWFANLIVMSGHQTGADIAAIDAAMEFKSGGQEFPFTTIGYVPNGAFNEAGPLHSKYTVIETASRGYPERTEKNVLYSHGTLIFKTGRITPGTGLTVKLCEKHQKPYLVIDLTETFDPIKIVQWIKDHKIFYLNVAGSRESTSPGTYDKVKSCVSEILGLLLRA